MSKIGKERKIVKAGTAHTQPRGLLRLLLPARVAGKNLTYAGNRREKVTILMHAVHLNVCSISHGISALWARKDLYLQDCNFSIFHWELCFSLKSAEPALLLAWIGAGCVCLWDFFPTEHEGKRGSFRKCDPTDHNLRERKEGKWCVYNFFVFSISGS